MPSPHLLTLPFLRTIDIQADLDLLAPRNRDVTPGRGNDDRLPATRQPIRLAQVHPNHQGLALDLHLDILCSHRPPPFPTAKPLDFANSPTKNESKRHAHS